MLCSIPTWFVSIYMMICILRHFHVDDVYVVPFPCADWYIYSSHFPVMMYIVCFIFMLKLIAFSCDDAYNVPFLMSWRICCSIFIQLWICHFILIRWCCILRHFCVIMQKEPHFRLTMFVLFHFHVIFSLNLHWLLQELGFFVTCLNPHENFFYRFLTELLLERQKLGPFIQVLPNCSRLLNQGTRVLHKKCLIVLGLIP